MPTYWAAVRDGDFAVPTDRPLPELVAELAEMLRSPDPQIRDGLAYFTLANWIDRGVLDTDRMLELGDEMAGRFDDPEIQSRTFAPLILTSIVSAGGFRASWVEPFERWYAAESDLRGYDERLGWLHAAAHGADLLGALGLCAEVDPVRILDLGAARLVAPTSHVFRDAEDDRLGYALATTLTRPELTPDTATGWIAAMPQLFEKVDPGPPPAELGNLLRTLRVVFALGELGVRRPDSTAPVAPPCWPPVREALVGVFRTAFPTMY